MALKHDWTQHAAHKKYGCVCVLRDFKSLEVACLDVGSINSLFWKYFFSLLLSVPRSSLVFHFSVGILFIFTLIWFKVDIKWRKKLKQNSYSLYLCTKNKKDEVEQTISFWFKIISTLFLSSCPSQLQGFWAVQHQINASLINPALPERASTWVLPSSLASLPGWVWSWGVHSPFPGQQQSSSWTRFLWWRGMRGNEQDPFLSPTKRKQSCLLDPPFVCPCKCLWFWENRDEPSARFLQESFIRLSSPGHRERGEIAWGDTSWDMAETSG